jgi:hypothetical protein
MHKVCISCERNSSRTFGTQSKEIDSAKVFRQASFVFKARARSLARDLNDLLQFVGDQRDYCDSVASLCRRRFAFR